MREDVFLENSKHATNKVAVLEERPSDPKRQKMEYIINDLEGPVKFTSNNIQTCNLALSTLKQTIFYKNLRDATQRLFEAGIIQRIPGKSIYTLKDDAQEKNRIAEQFQIYNRKRVNVVLNWKDLCAGFYVWIGAAFLSIVVFIGENVKFRFSKFRN